MDSAFGVKHLWRYSSGHHSPAVGLCCIRLCDQVRKRAWREQRLDGAKVVPIVCKLYCWRFIFLITITISWSSSLPLFQRKHNSWMMLQTTICIRYSSLCRAGSISAVKIIVSKSSHSLDCVDKVTMKIVHRSATSSSIDDDVVELQLIITSFSMINWMNSSNEIIKVTATSAIDIYNKHFHINEHYTKKTTYKLFIFFDVRQRCK